MGLGQQVHAAEGGVALGHLGQHRLGGVGQDGVGQVSRAQQREVVAPGQAGHPGHLVFSRDMAPGPLSPVLGQLGEAPVALGGPGGDGGRLADAHVLDRARLAAVGGHEGRHRLGAPPVHLVGPAGELGHERLGHARDLVAGPGRVAPGAGFPAVAERLGEQVGQDALVQLALSLASPTRVRGPPSGNELSTFSLESEVWAVALNAEVGHPLTQCRSAATTRLVYGSLTSSLALRPPRFGPLSTTRSTELGATWSSSPSPSWRASR